MGSQQPKSSLAKSTNAPASIDITPLAPQRTNATSSQQQEAGWRDCEAGNKARTTAPTTGHKSSGFLLKSDDHWYWELSASIIGGAIVIAIATLLKHYDGKPVPIWPVRLTSIVAVLATLAKGALLLAVTAAISQHKWFWYRHRSHARKLLDMEIFDLASRGPWGALVLVYHLLFKWRKWSVAVVGSIVILSSILFEFAGQQALEIAIYASPVNSSATIVRRMQSFKDLTHMADSRVGFRNPLGRAVTLGVLSSTGTPQLQPSCPTADCDWPQFSSLGVCNRCIDLSAQVRTTQTCNTKDKNLNLWCVVNTESTGSQNLTFGYSGNGPPSYFNATVYASANSWPRYGSIFGGSEFAGIGYPIYAFQGFDYKISQLTEDTFQYELLAAVECAFFACIKTYNVSVRNGVPEQNVLSTWHNESYSTIKNLFPVYGTYSPDLYLVPPKKNNDTYSPEPYKMDGSAMSTIAGSLSDCFSDTITLSDTDNLSSESTSECPQWIYSDGNVTRSAEDIALSLTDYIQTSEGSELVTGTSFVVENHVRFRWRWLLLPIAISGLSLAFLTVTITETMKNPDTSWKASCMALIYHGPDSAELMPTNVAPPNRLSEMKTRAKITNCQLRKHDRQAWKLRLD